ncbi:MAG: FecR family protein [Terrimicrobiaceae bacterium]|nr:FecR family protein [Terrimicrobiaceae bacterium]
MRTILAGLLAACSMTSFAATLQNAEVTVAVNRVLISPSGGALRDAAVGDTLGGAGRLETGTSSRAELIFNDRSIARLGANSVFAFTRGTRQLELNQGVIFLQVPKGAGGATIQTAAVTAAITGTTIAIEYSPAGANGPGAIKVFVLEGTLRVYLKSRPGESLLLEPGQMIFLEPDATSLPEPQVFDIARLVATSGLLGGQFPPLPSMPEIEENIAEQDRLKINGTLVISNYVLHAELPGGAADFLNQVRDRTLQSQVVQTPPAPPVVREDPPPPPPTPPPTPPPAPKPSPLPD